MSFLYPYGVDHTDGGQLVSSLSDAQVQALLVGLRSLIRPNAADARAVVSDAWSLLAEALSEAPMAESALAALLTVRRADESLRAAQDSSRRLGAVLGRLEAAPCTVAGLSDVAPQLVVELGFDRAIFSRIVDGVWVSQSVCVPDDPQWAAEINRVGQEQPQPLVPGLHETEVVRRREARIVTDVQHDRRVHRPIADASRSTSYVAAPVMSGGRVVGLLHGDCYRQNRDIDATDVELLAGYANGLALALSRARAVEQLDALGSVLRFAANDCDEAVAGAHEFTLDDDVRTQAGIPLAPRVVRRALNSIRDVLTPRENEILEEMAQGRTNAAIATKLFISEGTVKQHVKHILRKVGAENRVEAVSLLYQSDHA